MMKTIFKTFLFAMIAALVPQLAGAYDFMAFALPYSFPCRNI